MTPTPQESFFFERCWQCRCLVPPDLVQRQMVKAGYVIGRGNPDRYEMASVCGVCAQNIQDEARALGQERSRTWGFLIGLLVLSIAGFPFPVSLLIMCVVAWGSHTVRKQRQLRRVS